MTITELIKFDKLKEENKEIEKLKQQQLFKKEFDLTCYAECNCDGEGCGYGLIDNSKWEQLSNKESK